jgi:PAS domain S-box-containing protein
VLPRPGGDLWAGTAAGLYRSEGDALSKVAGDRLVIDRPIFFMVRDRHDRVWFGTDNGVERWDGSRLEQFTVKDGLAGRETHRAAGLVDSRGDVWIGTERGATVYSERLPGPRPVPPIVELDQVEAAGRLQGLASPLALDSDENDLTFQFRIVSLIDEGRLTISRRLEGFESGWRSLPGSLERQVRYTNLPPGEYRLHLKAANARGVWSDSVVSAAITIARPYWQQPWFYLALVSVVASALYSVQRHLAQTRYSRRLEAEVAARVAELHASEERYRHIFERSQAVKLLVDAETQSIIDANRAACRFYGHLLQDLKRLSLDDLRVQEPEAIDLSTDSGTHLLAERHRCAGDEIRDVELYSSAAEVQGRPIFYVIVQDVTERRLAEETMSTERERLAATLRNIDDGVITTDAGGKILLLNRKAEEITGWTGRRTVGRQLEEVLRLYEAPNNGVPPAGVPPAGVPPAGVRPTDLGERLHLVSGDEAGALASGIWRIVPAAARAPRLAGPRFGEPRSLSRGSLSEVSGVSRRRPRLKAFEPIEEAVLVTPAGERKLVELSGSPIRQGGRVSGLVLAFRDITERRRIESELAKTQKLEALGLLAGGIAHDFNNLLTVLLGHLSLLSHARGLDGRETRNLEAAQTAVLRARDLTQQLLTFSRGGTPVREAASIAEVISESASFVLSGSKVRCEIELPEDLWVVEIDAGQISQVINNLLINAMQAMPEGGTVTVRGENLDRPPSSLKAGRYVVIEVIDQGVGIPREYQSRIFDPYFSTKEKGRGLGLASAYSIAKQHDGLLEVASQPGQGTTFSLYLPASETQAVAPPPDEAEALTGSGRVLIMDDDDEVRSVTGAMVEQLGYRVEHAADGAEAVELYRRALAGTDPFDAVIMDLTIPGGMGGQAAIRHLLHLDPAVRAIVASGYSNDPVLSSYRAYGFRDRISKPFRSDDLARVLRRVLAERPPAAEAAG